MTYENTDQLAAWLYEAKHPLCYEDTFEIDGEAFEYRKRQLQKQNCLPDHLNDRAAFRVLCAQLPPPIPQPPAPSIPRRVTVPKGEVKSLLNRVIAAIENKPEPTFHVEAPIIPAPEVHVSAPQVNVEAAPAPIVNVTVEPPLPRWALWAWAAGMLILEAISAFR